MSCLNWKETKCHLKSVVLPLEKIQLFLELPIELLPSLLESLEDVYSEDREELRVYMPQDWTLFWKMRDEGSRALAAHPQAEEWVGTIALDAKYGREWISSLRKLKSGDSLALSSLGSTAGISALAKVSNLDLLISVK